jgi:hypothetical protein
LEAAGLGASAADDFANLFGLVAAAPRRKLDVGWPHCPVLSPDEGRLVQLMGFLQRNRINQASEILADWLTPAAARHALAPASSVARGFGRLGLIVPHRHRTDVAFGKIENPQFGITLLH